MGKTTNKYSPEMRERAVRMVLDNRGQHESRWAAIVSVSSKIGCAAQTLNEWVKRAEVDPSNREHKTPVFLALNPRGKVPVLVDGDLCSLSPWRFSHILNKDTRSAGACLVTPRRRSGSSGNGCSR